MKTLSTYPKKTEIDNLPIWNKIIMYNLFDPYVNKIRPFHIIDPKDFYKVIQEVNDNKLAYVEHTCLPQQQTKAYFEIDYKVLKCILVDAQAEWRILSDVCGMICKVLKVDKDKKLFNGDKIDIRMTKRIEIYYFTDNEGKEMKKYSYHFVVNNVRISYSTLLQMINDAGYGKDYKGTLEFDLSVYNGSNGLTPIFSKNKSKDKRVEVKSQFVPIDIFGQLIEYDETFDVRPYCLTYVEESFTDLDAKYEPKKQEEPKKQDKALSYKEVQKDGDDECDDGDKTTTFENKLEEHIMALSNDRADDYNDWLGMMFCIINIYKKKQLSRRKCENLLHIFSKKCSHKYKEDDVDKWIDTNYDRAKEQGYGWPYLQQCLKQDNPDYYEKKVSKTYHTVKKEFEQEIHKCMNPVGFLRVLRSELALEGSREPIQFLTRDKLLGAYEEKKYWEMEVKKNGEKKWVKKSFVKDWLEDENKNIYEEVVFKPYHLDTQLSKKYYNLYEGTRAELLPVHRDYEAIQPVLDHIKNVMVNGNEAHYDWLLQYFAQMIQNPTKKTQVCIVFHGKQGCGKNIIIDAFANGILGRKLALSTATPEQSLFGRFNACCLNKILVVCNELGSELYGYMNRFKDLVTAPDSISEKKHQDPVIVENYKNVICTTNEKNPLNISADDRRLVWFDCNNKYIGDEEYFDKLIAILEDDKNISSLYHYFKEEVKITITNFQKKRPITKGYKRIQVLNLPSYVRWCKDYYGKLIFKKYKGVETSVHKQKIVYDDYKSWCERCKYTALKRDTFFHHLEDEETGITCCKFDGYDSYRFSKEKVLAWLEKQGVMKQEGEVEEISKEEYGDFVEDSDEE